MMEKYSCVSGGDDNVILTEQEAYQIWNIIRNAKKREGNGEYWIFPYSLEISWDAHVFY